MTLTLAPGFTGSRLDRADALRDDPARIDAMMADRRARLLRLEALDPALDADGRLDWGSLAEAPYDGPLAFLGLLDDAPRFVALVPAPPAVDRSRALTSLLDLMPSGEASTFAAARSLVDWHARHGWCARCGSPTEVIRAGWARRCGACLAEHFPRTDPVVIMLAEHAGRVLVGRQAAWPEGRYSALAGFVEVGESVEEAVRRELYEEAGVRAGAVRFVASQPWPFPSQLMMACIAGAADDALTIDGNELQAAIWVDRAGVAAALAGDPAAPFLPPPRYAIAHTLFFSWLKQSS